MKISNWMTNVANQPNNDLDWPRFTCFVAKTYQSQITRFWGKILNSNFCLCKNLTFRNSDYMPYLHSLLNPSVKTVGSITTDHMTWPNQLQTANAVDQLWFALIWKVTLICSYLKIQGSEGDATATVSEMYPGNQISKTSQELQMLSSVTINCQVTKIVMNSDSQLSEL